MSRASAASGPGSAPVEGAASHRAHTKDQHSVKEHNEEKVSSTAGKQTARSAKSTVARFPRLSNATSQHHSIAEITALCCGLPDSRCARATPPLQTAFTHFWVYLSTAQPIRPICPSSRPREEPSHSDSRTGIMNLPAMHVVSCAFNRKNP